MIPRKKYLLTLKLSKYQPARLPSLGQKIQNNNFEVEKTYKVAQLTAYYWLTKIFNLFAKVSTKFYLGLYIYISVVSRGRLAQMVEHSLHKIFVYGDPWGPEFDSAPGFL